MGTVGRGRFDGKMKSSALNTSRDRGPWAAQKAEAAGSPDGKVQESESLVQLNTVCPVLRTSKPLKMDHGSWGLAAGRDLRLLVHGRRRPLASLWLDLQS